MSTEARLSASIIINKVIKLSFTGPLVDCSTNTSDPRTLSSILIETSPSLNFFTLHLLSSTPSDFATCCANGILAFNENSFNGLSTSI